MDSLPVRKIYVDSRFKTSYSKSDSDFSIELPQSYYMPLGTTMLVDDFQCPHSWYTVEENLNDRLYVKEDAASGSIQTRVLQLPARNYSGASLATVIASLLNVGSLHTASPAYVVSHSGDTGKITISLNTSNPADTFRIYTDSELAGSGITGFVAMSVNPMSANEVLRHSGTSTPHNKHDTGFLGPFISEFIDIQAAAHTLYLHSSLTDMSSVCGVRGESSVIKKIPVTENFGFSIIDYIRNPDDSVNVGGQTLKTMEFRLTNAYGVTIPLHGGTINFSLAFKAT